MSRQQAAEALNARAITAGRAVLTGDPTVPPGIAKLAKRVLALAERRAPTGDLLAASAALLHATHASGRRRATTPWTTHARWLPTLRKTDTH